MTQPYCFTQTLPYPMEPLFHIVKDVEKYSEFVPGITDAQTYNHGESCFTGKLTIGYKKISQSYQSHVTYGINNQSAYVHSNAIDGPFHHLISQWNLRSLSPNSTEITLTLDFKMKQSFLNKVLSPYLNRGALEFIAAFEKRAHTLLTDQYDKD